jgi:hypothetical protein
MARLRWTQSQHWVEILKAGQPELFAHHREVIRAGR